MTVTGLAQPARCRLGFTNDVTGLLDRGQRTVRPVRVGFAKPTRPRVVAHGRHIESEFFGGALADQVAVGPTNGKGRRPDR